ncbi:phenylalanine--tRNA ligase subunit beta [Candidatus Woesearchaeota archaeon]|nr:phenylalanine--tRNA ligase subunit beta [Candidatus Woesearchaeota archaeon]
MPTATLNKKVFEKLVGKKLPLEKLKDRISMLGTDLEKIEKNEIIVEVFPNRPDMLSEQGFARAFSSFIGAKTGLRKYYVKKSDYKVTIDKSVKNVRPYTVCAVVKNLKLDDEKIRELIQIQEKLHITLCRKRKKGAIGIYPIEDIKFPIRFLAEDPRKIKFRPLEFPREITGLQILSQHPAGREYADLLEGLDKFPIFMDAKKQILSMPPIINSHLTGKVGEKTKEVFIECSGFELEILKTCLNIIVAAMADMGGEIYSVKVEMPPGYKNKKILTPDLEPKKWSIDLKFVNRLLGLDLKENEMKKSLERMGYGYEKGKVLVPAYRADIMHQVDFAEDIAIAYGYENFEPVIPNVSTIGEENQFEVFKRHVAEILAGLELLECETYNLSNIDNLNRKMNIELPCIQIENAVNIDYNVLRSWVLPSLMQVFNENKHYEYPQNIFTIGTAFKKNKDKETGVEEFSRTAVALCGPEADYTKIRQMFDYLMNCLNIEAEFSEEDHPSFIPGRCARIKIKGKGIAYIGEINPSVLVNWDLQMPVSAFELNLTDLFSILNKQKK